MSYESQEHLELKEDAKAILNKHGFSKEEIMVEYELITPKDKLYVIDVVGINKNKKVFIECGNVPKNKMEDIKPLCDELIRLPFKKEYKIPKPKKLLRKISMTVDAEVYDDFKVFCVQKGMKISSIVSIMMKNLMDKNQ